MNKQQTRLTGDADEAAALLRIGAIVALPTETVYGLAGNATHGEAIAGIYEAKGRPRFNPLIAHVTDTAAAFSHIEATPLLEQLAAAFWPGPLTLLGRARASSPIHPLCRAGLADQAVRVPDHPMMQAVLQAFGRPLAAPSANASGRISPTTAAHVLESLAGRIPLILDGGACSVGLESTIVTDDGGQLHLLRAGAITAEAITAVTGQRLLGLETGTIRAPGQLASHYAPQKPLLLNMLEAPPESYMIGFGEIAGDVSLSAAGDLREAAANLFAHLYRADASNAACIAVAPIPEHGLGLAINDRLQRAAVR
jgi:L-threonylcarbamoyladenylate synthase